MGRTQAQIAVSRTNGSKSRGPFTKKGKATSAANSRRHGVFARGVLYPGENLGAYRELQSEYADAFRPKNGPEFVVVAELTDLAWRLKRLAGFEKGICMRRLQDRIDATQLFRIKHQTTNCLITVRATVATVNEVPPRESVAQMAAFLDGLEGLVTMLQGLEGFLPADLIPLEVAGELLTSDSNGSTIKPQRYHDLGPILRRLEEVLVGKLQAESDALEDQRRNLAQSELLLSGDEVARLDRYRRGLEAAQARQLELLKTVRASSTEATGERPAMQLRIVR